MDSLKPLSILVILVCLVGGIYYTVVDNETNGAIVALLGILYFLGAPRIVGECVQPLGPPARAKFRIATLEKRGAKRTPPPRHGGVERLR